MIQRVSRFMPMAFCCFLLLFCCYRPVFGQITIVPGISTVAGDGTAGYTGDGNAAISSELNRPNGVTLDGAGNLYIADTWNNVIRKVSASTGTITTVAGNGTAGYIGDGGAATSAELNSPEDVAVDSAGNLYISDNGNNVIREVSPSGIISTVAGNGTAGYSGDGASATSSELDFPFGIALDSAGNLYIADEFNDAIREVVSSTGIITTVAGDGKAGYSGDGSSATSATLRTPAGVIVDAAGDIYIADTGNNVVRKVTVSTGTISTVAGDGTQGFAGDDGTATSAELNRPNDIALDDADNLYIADTDNYRIREVNSSTGVITTIAGNGADGYSGDAGVATGAAFNGPSGIVVDNSNNVYIADLGNSVIRKMEVSTTYPTTQVGSSSEVENQFIDLTADQSVSSITVAASQGGKQEYVVGTISGCTADGTTVNASGTICTVPVTFQPAYPGLRNMPLTVTTNTGSYTTGLSGIGMAPQVAFTPGTINTVAGNGTQGYSGDGGAATSAELDGASGIAVDSAGNLYFADYNNEVIRKITVSTGIITTVAGNGTSGYSGDGGQATSAELNSPIGVAVDSAGDLYIVDYGNEVIRKVTSTGIITTVAGNGTQGYSGDGGQATNAELNGPYSLAVDSVGNIYIGEYGNSRIRKVSASTGIITTVAGNGTQGYSGDGGAATSAELDSPDGVAVDSVGNIYIADDGNYRIRKVAALTGIITTVAGNGTQGYSGDGGAATSAELYSPDGVAVDSAGNIYIVDGGGTGRVTNPNAAIRRVNASTGTITTVAGSGTPGYSGDGGPATSAELNAPDGVAVDSMGNIYISDSKNQRIREVNVSSVPTINFPTATDVDQTDSVDGPATVIVSNIGNEPLTLTTPESGSNPGYPSDFPMNGNDADLCSVSSQLVSGATCDVSANFQPISAAVVTGSVVLTDDALNQINNGVGVANQTVTLSGTGILNTATVNLTSSTNPSVFGSPVTFSVTVTGSGSTPTGTVLFEDSGSIIGSGALDGSGDATYSTTSLATGTHSITARYTGESDTYSNSVSTALSQVINQAVPSCTSWPTANSIAAGQALSSSTLSGGSCSTPGSFTWTSPSSVPAAGIQSESVTFTPTDSVDYAMVSGSVNVTVSTDMIGLIKIGPWSGTPGLYLGGATPDSYPYQLAMDSAGNVYMADSAQDQVIKFTVSTGAVAVFAGTTGTAGYSGDGAAATAALLNSPTGVAVDSAGNVYIADTLNNKIRVVNTSGVISTLAQSGSTCSAPVSLALDTNGYLYVSSQSNLVCKIALSTGSTSVVAGTGTAGYTGDGGLATQAELNAPFGIAIDVNGNLFIADSSNNVVRRIDSSTGDISTVVGNGTEGYSGDGGAATDAELAYPYSVSFDAAGNLYIADDANNAIRMVSASTNNIDTIAEPTQPAGVIADSYGNLYISNETAWLEEAALYQPLSLLTPWGNTTTQSLTFTNIGQATVIINGATTSGTAFSVASGGSCDIGSQLAPQQSCSVSIAFSPASVGSFTGSFVLSYSGANTTQASVALAGDGELDTPTISSCPIASTIPYGERVTQSILSGGSASVPGTFSWGVSGRSAAPTLGTHEEPVNFTPTDTTDYNTTSCTTELIVGQATPSISVWPTSSGISYGQALSASTLSGGTASVPGTFTWSTPSTMPSGGTGSYSVTFTPTDTTDYTVATGTTSLTVSPADASVAIISAIDPSSYGQTATFTVTATGLTGFATPTGTLTVVDNGSCTSSCTGTTLASALQLSGGTASFQNAVLTGGQHNLVVTYSGDSNYAPSN